MSGERCCPGAGSMAHVRGCVNHPEPTPTPVPSEVAETTAGEHHPACYQSTGVPDHLPAGLCDCKVLRMLDAAENTTGEREVEALAKVLADHWLIHRSVEGPNTSCSGCDWAEYVPFGSSAVLAHQAHLVTLLAALLDRVRREVEAKVRDEERADWSAWLDGWTGAVGPNPPTVEAVADALRSGPRPFGRAASVGRGEGL